MGNRQILKQFDIDFKLISDFKSDKNVAFSTIKSSEYDTRC